MKAPIAAGLIINQVSVSASTNDPNLANNTTTQTTQVNALSNLSLTKEDLNHPVELGDLIGYTLRVENLGPSAASQVTVTDSLPLPMPAPPTRWCLRSIIRSRS